MAPSHSVAGMSDAVEACIAHVEALGFEVRRGRHLYDTSLDFPCAGSPEHRAADLNDMLAHSAVGLILCALGGWGSLALLDRMDDRALARDPSGFWASAMLDPANSRSLAHRCPASARA